VEVGTTTIDAVLTCWKDIANYLGKGVRTVQRWEQLYGLPVRRPMGAGAKGAVIAHTADLMVWLESNWLERKDRHGRVEPTASDQSVDDLIRTSVRLRTYHRDLTLETANALKTLAARCAQFEISGNRAR
jgi:hypothetical protein